MKYFIFFIFIKSILNQIQTTNTSNNNENSINRELKKLKIKYNIFNDTNILIYNYNNDNEKNFILNQNTYIIYPSNNKIIEQHSSVLSSYIKNITGIEIGVTPNMAMKMSNKIKNNFIHIILENINSENKNNIVNIKINHRKILIKSKELVGIRQGINIIKDLLEKSNNVSNTTYDEIYFSPIEIIYTSNIKNNKFMYYGILVAFILILFGFYKIYL